MFEVGERVGPEPVELRAQLAQPVGVGAVDPPRPIGASAGRERGSDRYGPDGWGTARSKLACPFDPNLVELLCADAEKVFYDLDDTESWDAVLDAEPALSYVLSPAECDEALAAISRFVDLKSPYTIGDSTAVADLASDAVAALGAPEHEVATVRRSALIARFGYLGVSNAIWDKPRPLSASEWERVRLYPYLTERMLQRPPALAPFGQVAVRVREQLDGSGYPRGLSGASITRPARVLAAADVYQAMLEPRPHRSPRTRDEAGAELRGEARSGRLDGEAVEAVLGVAGHRVARRIDGPAGLTRREIEVLRLIARGATNKDVAARLVISPKTAGTTSNTSTPSLEYPAAPKQVSSPRNTASYRRPSTTSAKPSRPPDAVDRSVAPPLGLGVKRE